MAGAALGILLGWRYRVSALLFFLLFTYTELWDLTNYLNHYYFVSLVAGLMVIVPANRSFSLDVRRNPELRATTVPAWTINILRLQLGLVYFFAGLAKLHPDWLLKAQPLRLWLSANADMPIIGHWLTYVGVAFAFSWAGALYDLFIPFLLCWRKARPLAYVAVVVFHILTWLLFPIGVFPWVMIFSTLIFFGAPFHEQLLHALRKLLRQTKSLPGSALPYWPARTKVMALALSAFVLFQLLFPFRYALYPGDLFWTEQGFRFSWRVMLMEKSGYIVFQVHNPETGHRIEVNNREFLTPLQEKMMATQPDMILQFAHFLKEEYRKKGISSPEIYAESWVSLNGRSARPFVNPDVNLAALKDSWAHRHWILPFEQTTYHAER